MNTAAVDSDLRQATSPRSPATIERSALQSEAIVFEGQQRLGVRTLKLVEPTEDDVIVDMHWSGVSTGTERLLWSGDMPPFPGLSYPLVPGYEGVGVVTDEGRQDGLLGRTVFVPGARCYRDAAGLFGASASRVILPADKVVPLDHAPSADDTLLALAATAHHAVVAGRPPQLVVGHGVLGRLIARITIALGHDVPTVWETNSNRRDEDGYSVLAPDADTRADYTAICDASGSIGAIDQMISRSARGGEIVLAGFYADRPSFDFPPAFMREMSFRIAAEWGPADLDAVLDLRSDGRLQFDGLVTHAHQPTDAAAAYDIAFGDPDCLKMVLDWRSTHDHAH